MTEQENNITDLQRHSAIQDARISNLEILVKAVLLNAVFALLVIFLAILSIML